MTLGRFLNVAALDDTALDGAARLESHARVLRRKPMLDAVFRDFHWLFHSLDKKFFDEGPGLKIEIGAGIAPVRNTFPDVEATDVVPAPHLDRVLDAQAMDLESGAVHALYGQNCFHHFPDPGNFLSEATRVLAPGGGVILIEPYFGPLASLIYPRLFASEDFNKAAPSWCTEQDGPMNGANQALSYIVFFRDRTLFEARFPELQIVHTAPIKNYLRYFLSGGLNFRQLAPNWACGTLRRAEDMLAPAAKWLALHHVIVLRRR